MFMKNNIELGRLIAWKPSTRQTEQADLVMRGEAMLQFNSQAQTYHCCHTAMRNGRRECYPILYIYICIKTKQNNSKLWSFVDKPRSQMIRNRWNRRRRNTNRIRPSLSSTVIDSSESTLSCSREYGCSGSRISLTKSTILSQRSRIPATKITNLIMRKESDRNIKGYHRCRVDQRRRRQREHLRCEQPFPS